jgi:hypothetical protein
MRRPVHSPGSMPSPLPDMDVGHRRRAGASLRRVAVASSTGCLALLWLVAGWYRMVPAPLWTMITALAFVAVVGLALSFVADRDRRHAARAREVEALALLHGDKELHTALVERREALVRQWEARS